LEREFGRRTLEESGWRIITTLDADLEAKAEEVVKKYGEENEKNFNASNAALVAIDPKTGDILTMAGSRDYFNNEIDGAYNIALANRQPGSSFKPFV
jgi:membrane peptidoglycan carboxypeptidase